MSAGGEPAELQIHQTVYESAPNPANRELVKQLFTVNMDSPSGEESSLHYNTSRLR